MCGLTCPPLSGNTNRNTDENTNQFKNQKEKKVGGVQQAVELHKTCLLPDLELKRCAYYTFIPKRPGLILRLNRVSSTLCNYIQAPLLAKIYFPLHFISQEFRQF